jgi:hypothetical protein
MGMPYQKVALMVAVVCAVFFTITLGNNNVVREAPVALWWTWTIPNTATN